MTIAMAAAVMAEVAVGAAQLASDTQPDFLTCDCLESGPWTTERPSLLPCDSSSTHAPGSYEQSYTQVVFSQ